MDLKELKELIRLVSEKGITEFELEREGIRLRICRAAQTDQAKPEPLPVPIAVPIAAPPLPPFDVAAATPSPVTAPLSSVSLAPAQSAAEEPMFMIKSPIVGTFYRAPSPTADPFVKLGDHVEKDSVVCIIEAMKLMNEIQAETVGEVVKIFVENGQPVEYGQPLFGIRA